jgi:hypothetical protein
MEWFSNLYRAALSRLLGKRQKTPEEIADDNERTNSMGLFNTAEAYWMSAVALQAAKVRAGHASQPVRFLYYHAIELYLKAWLRQHFPRRADRSALHPERWQNVAHP